VSLTTEKYLDSKSVCQLLGISKRTLATYVKERRIPFSRFNRQLKFRESSLTAWLATRENIARPQVRA
jgi:excisionase family DNA binding protein